MAWRFRKSIKLGPVRLNLSKSGIGTSIGVRGFRVGQDAKGRSYTAASIPGTGIYNRTYTSQGKEGNATPESVAPQGRSSGMGLAVGMLLLAFLAGGLVVSVLTPHPAPAPAPPPAAVTEPVAPPPATPLKRRRAHGSRRAIAPAVPHRSGSPDSLRPQTSPRPASDVPSSAN
ncbi:MAG: DUF4236 domain-containing protein [Terracidiphilus sp.]|nr:DUF4236 domain-containing protein [Terracidiphilus sp.]